MVQAKELRIGNILYHTGKDLFVLVETVDKAECTVTPYSGGDGFSVSFEELDGIQLTGETLLLSGFKEGPAENEFSIGGLYILVPEATFFVMDRTDSAISTRLTSVHHLQNVYAALNLKELLITLPSYK